MGTTAVKPYIFLYAQWAVWFARYCGKMYSCHLFSYGGFCLSFKEKQILQKSTVPGLGSEIKLRSREIREKRGNQYQNYKYHSVTVFFLHGKSLEN